MKEKIHDLKTALEVLRIEQTVSFDDCQKLMTDVHDKTGFTPPNFEISGNQWCVLVNLAVARFGNTTPPQRKPMWIDPNDKTQAKFLPNIGEPVVFCCRGETYIGTHTGGGFQDVFDEENYFNTWSCRWMPISFIEAAHGIKE